LRDAQRLNNTAGDGCGVEFFSRSLGLKISFLAWCIHPEAEVKFTVIKNTASGFYKEHKLIQLKP
jgi:hypothetical protein